MLTLRLQREVANLTFTGKAASHRWSTERRSVISTAIVVAKFVPVIVVPVTPTRASAVIASGEHRNKNDDHPCRVKLSTLPANRFHDQILETNARNTRPLVVRQPWVPLSAAPEPWGAQLLGEGLPHQSRRPALALTRARAPEASVPHVRLDGTARSPRTRTFRRSRRRSERRPGRCGFPMPPGWRSRPPRPPPRRQRGRPVRGRRTGAHR